MQPKKLENYKYFSLIAWTLCVGFAGFVVLLVMNVNNKIHSLENSSLSFEQRTKIFEVPANEIPSL